MALEDNVSFLIWKDLVVGWRRSFEFNYSSQSRRAIPVLRLCQFALKTPSSADYCVCENHQV